ncbi:MAG: PHB depolymerase family esterase [Polyangiaceae bacterium]
MRRWLLVVCVCLGFLVCVFVDACAEVPLGTLTGRGGRSQAGALFSGGRRRTFWYHLPSTPAPANKPPLAISLHGRGADGHEEEWLTGYSMLADRDGFIAAYPDGVESSWADGRGTTQASLAGVDDVAYLRDLIDLFVREQHADATRETIDGVSNGGMMALTAACKLADRLAGVGAVAGLVPEAIAASRGDRSTCPRSSSATRAASSRRARQCARSFRAESR